MIKCRHIVIEDPNMHFPLFSIFFNFEKRKTIRIPTPFVLRPPTSPRAHLLPRALSFSPLRFTPFIPWSRGNVSPKEFYSSIRIKYSPLFISLSILSRLKGGKPLTPLVTVTEARK
jgi:hypothetical protein